MCLWSAVVILHGNVMFADDMHKPNFTCLTYYHMFFCTMQFCIWLLHDHMYCKFARWHVGGGAWAPPSVHTFGVQFDTTHFDFQPDSMSRGGAVDLLQFLHPLDMDSGGSCTPCNGYNQIKPQCSTMFTHFTHPFYGTALPQHLLLPPAGSVRILKHTLAKTSVRS